MMQGEWWIMADGSVAFADGDVADWNHEAYVYDHLIREWGEVIGMDVEGMEADCHEFRVQFGFWADQQGGDPDEIYEDVERQMAEFYKSEAQADTARRILFSDGVDGRDYACRYLGWVRIMSNHIQTFTLTRAMLRRIGDGLTEIHDQERLTGTWYIDVQATRTLYENVPTHVVLQDNPTHLNEYRRRY